MNFNIFYQSYYNFEEKERKETKKYFPKLEFLSKLINFNFFKDIFYLNQ